jgi:hypothetical protein
VKVWFVPAFPSAFSLSDRTSHITNAEYCVSGYTGRGGRSNMRICEFLLLSCVNDCCGNA